jgi:uncharacterized protein (DUF2237 family)
MKLIRPTTITPAMLTNSTAIEVYANYSAGTTYAVGATVVYETGIYESLQASNLNKTPDVSPTWWTLLGPSNRWAMFDSQISTTTKASTSLTVTLDSGIMDTLAVVGVDAELVTLTVRDGASGPIVYQRSVSVTGADVVDWYEYFFTDPTLRRSIAVFYDIPPYASASATLTITSGGDLTVGMVTFGVVTELGCTEFGAQAGITDYSRKETDDFGTTTFVKRSFSKKLTVSVWVEALQVNRVQRTLYDLRATPVLWIAADAPEYSEPLTVYGFYRDFYCSISHPTVSTYQLEIEGLI